MDWLLVHAHTNKEECAQAAIIAACNVDTWLPRMTDGSAAFPGYLFSRPADIREINKQPGVLRVVTFGDQPGMISESEIDRLKTLNLTLNRLREGQDVTITEGLYQYTHGQIDSIEGQVVKVKVKMMNGNAEMLISLPVRAIDAG